MVTTLKYRRRRRRLKSFRNTGRYPLTGDRPPDVHPPWAARTPSILPSHLHHYTTHTVHALIVLIFLPFISLLSCSRHQIIPPMNTSNRQPFGSEFSDMNTFLPSPSLLIRNMFTTPALIVLILLPLITPPSLHQIIPPTHISHCPHHDTPIYDINSILPSPSPMITNIFTTLLQPHTAFSSPKELLQVTLQAYRLKLPVTSVTKTTTTQHQQSHLLEQPLSVSITIIAMSNSSSSGKILIGMFNFKHPTEMPSTKATPITTTATTTTTTTMTTLSLNPSSSLSLNPPSSILSSSPSSNPPRLSPHLSSRFSSRPSSNQLSSTSSSSLSSNISSSPLSGPPIYQSSCQPSHQPSIQPLVHTNNNNNDNNNSYYDYELANQSSHTPSYQSSLHPSCQSSRHPADVLLRASICRF